MANTFENRNYGNRENNFRRNNAKNYVREFTDFSEGYSCMINLVPEVKLYGGDEADYDTVVQKLANSIIENIPTYDNPNYPNTLSFSISSREVGFLTDEKLAFGWRVYFSRELNSRIYQMRITFLNFSMSKRKYIKILEENGWQENEDIAKTSSFIRSISNNRGERFFNNSNNSQFPTTPKQENNEPAPEEEVKEEPVYEETVEEETVQEEPSAEVEQTEVADDSAILSESNINSEEYNISKTASDNVFVIQYKDKNFVVNITDDSDLPDDLYVDHGERIIGYRELKYDYKTGEVFIIDSDKDEEHKARVFAETAEQKRNQL
jgi:hypothetical protein